MRTKICGITNSIDAKLISTLSPWAIGFNFSKYSVRCIQSTQAKEFISLIQEKILRIGVFVEQSAYDIAKTMTELNLNFAQVYQDNPKLNRQKCILSLQAHSKEEIPPLCVLEMYAYVLLDAPQMAIKQYGGTGRLANWQLAKDLSSRIPLILAGGLTPQNIEEAIDHINPFAVDVCSGIEKAPGKKDSTLLKHFLEKTTDV